MPTKESKPTTPTSPRTTPSPSSSATATAPETKRIVVVERPSTERFSAYQLAQPETHTTGLGRQLAGQPRDWVLIHAGVVFDILADDVFRHRYQVADADSLTISGDDRRAIEQDLGPGSTLDGARLAGAVGRLARLTIGNIRIDFTPGQWEELHHRASKRGITVEKLVEQIVAKITADIWQV